MKKRSLLLLASCLMLSLSHHVSAQAPVAPVTPERPSMASGRAHHVVFAVTSGDPIDWNMTVGNIRNLVAQLKPDVTEVEVVAYAQGLSMIKQGSVVAADIAALQEKSGVKFVACQNAMRFQHVEAKDLLPGVGQVPAGIIEVVTKQEQGWSYIKGGR
jgi:intracellular sulfur oxidation DsrE/DsrF family protein